GARASVFAAAIGRRDGGRGRRGCPRWRAGRLPAPGGPGGAHRAGGDPGHHQVDLLGRADLLRRGERDARSQNQRVGQSQQRRDRSRDDQPERDQPKGLGGGRVRHHAGRPRPRTRSAAAAVDHRAVGAARRVVREDRRRPGRLVRGDRRSDRPQPARRRADRDPVRFHRQRALPPHRRAGTGRVHRSTGDLGGIARAGRGGPSRAAVRAGAGPLQRRRRQPPGLGPPILRRPDRRRRRQAGDDQVRGDPGLPGMGVERLRGRPLPARSDHLGRGGRQHRLPLWPSRLHRQPRQRLPGVAGRRPRTGRADGVQHPAGRSSRAGLADPAQRPRDLGQQPEPGRRDGLDRHSGRPRLHGGVLQGRHLRPGAEEPTPVRDLQGSGPRRLGRSGPERHRPGRTRHLQRRLRRVQHQLPGPEDGPARRRRRLRLRPGDGRGPAAGAGDLRQVPV
ncbi:MAG: hypothetical protein AVDCRST_MAG73-2161, partial [uncultured Thermomicrobiales bacterium]